MDEVLAVRMDADEKERVRRGADAAGLTMSELARQSTLRASDAILSGRIQQRWVQGDNDDAR